MEIDSAMFPGSPNITNQVVGGGNEAKNRY